MFYVEFYLLGCISWYLRHAESRLFLNHGKSKLVWLRLNWAVSNQFNYKDKEHICRVSVKKVWRCIRVHKRRRELFISESYLFMKLLYEPLHDKTNKLTCAPSKDSDHPGHPPSLIIVFAVCMTKPWPGPQLPIECTAKTQTDLSLHWVHRSFCWFCHAVARISIFVELIKEKEHASFGSKCHI